MSTLTWKETRFLQVPLTADEIRERGEQLANLVRERGELQVTQKAERDRMRTERDRVEGRIHRIAGVVIVRARDGRVVRYAFSGGKKAG